MQTLERRIAELEKATPSAGGIDLIITRIIPDDPNAEMQHAQGDNGECWRRQPGESEREFLDRAAGEVKQRNAWGIAHLIVSDCAPT